MKTYLNHLIIYLSTLVFLGATFILKQNPLWVEKIYSKGVYSNFYEVRTWFFNRFSGSLGDLLYASLLIWIIWNVSQLIRYRRLISLARIVSTAALLLVYFQLSWGLNYHRVPLANKLSDNSIYTLEELEELTLLFADKSNTLHAALSDVDSVAVTFHASPLKRIEQIEEQYRQTGFCGKAKISRYSHPLLYAGFTGYLNPFTLEAQVNGKIPPLNLPITIAHEIAHQMGYAAENEANFIGFMHCYSHKDLNIQYAANLFAFRHCYRELHHNQPESAKRIVKMLRPGILMNFSETSAFWRQYQNPLEPYLKKSYDTYLKANSQSSGIQSYNGVVGLMIQSFRQNKSHPFVLKNNL